MRWWCRRRGGEGSKWRRWRRRRCGGWALPARSSCAAHSAVCAATAFMTNPCRLPRPSPPPPCRPSRPLRRGIGSFSRGQRSTSESEASRLRAVNAAIGGGRCGWSGRAGLVPQAPPPGVHPGLAGCSQGRSEAPSQAPPIKLFCALPAGRARSIDDLFPSPPAQGRAAQSSL